MRATLIVPTLNEERSIGHVLDSFAASVREANPRLFPDHPVVWDVIVVDGRSTDRTVEIARSKGVPVLMEPRPGYGRAYRSGFEAATGEYVATLDGDATYPVEEVMPLLRTLLDRNLDFISGDRLARIDRRAMTTEHRIGNWVLNAFVRIAFHHYFAGVRGGTLKDSQSGMWVFKRSILPQLRLTQDGMPLSEELKLEVVLRGFRFEEVAIAYRERWGAPKLSSWRDGRHNLAYLFQKRFELSRERRRLGYVPLAHRERVPD